MSFKSLNAYQFNDESIKDIREYLEHHIIPRTITTDSSKFRFVRKARRFLVDGQNLTSGGLEVVPDDDITKKLDALYQDPATGGGIGRDKFYDKVKQRYIGITKEDVMEFLDNQESYQLNKPYIKSKIVSPIVPTHAGQRYQMDLIILKALKSQNSGYKYILTVIDAFSKFAYATPLKSKSGESVANAVRDIILISGKKPTVWQSDNGKEFIAEEMKRVMNRFGIKQVFSLPYTPQSQGLVENFNKYVKHSIRNHMFKENTKRWVDVLHDIIYNWNTSKHGITEEEPAIVDETNDVRILSEVRKNIANSAEGMINSQAHIPPLKVGNWVRVSRGTTRDGRRDKWDKLAENWSSDIYKVVSISQDNAHKRGQYTLETENGSRVKKVYYRADLLKIDKAKLVKDVAPEKKADDQPLPKSSRILQLRDETRGEREDRTLPDEVVKLAQQNIKLRKEALPDIKELLDDVPVADRTRAGKKANAPVSTGQKKGKYLIPEPEKRITRASRK